MAKTSVTKQGKYEPFGLQVAEGQIPYHSAVTMFNLIFVED